MPDARTLTLPPPGSEQVLHDALRSCRPITVRLLNYRADDTPFVNDLTVLPIADPTTGATTHFLGIMRDRPLPGARPHAPWQCAVCRVAQRQPQERAHARAQRPTPSNQS